MEGRDPSFRFLSNAEFDLLTTAERDIYLARAQLELEELFKPIPEQFEHLRKPQSQS